MYQEKSCAASAATEDKGAAFLLALNVNHSLPIKDFFKQAVVD